MASVRRLWQDFRYFYLSQQYRVKLIWEIQARQRTGGAISEICDRIGHIYAQEVIR